MWTHILCGDGDSHLNIFIFRHFCYSVMHTHTLFALIRAQDETKHIYPQPPFPLSLSIRLLFCKVSDRVRKRWKGGKCMTLTKQMILRCRWQCNVFVNDLNGQTQRHSFHICQKSSFFFQLPLFGRIYNVYKLFVVQTIFFDFNIVVQQWISISKHWNAGTFTKLMVKQMSVYLLFTSVDMFINVEKCWVVTPLHTRTANALSYSNRA